MFIRRCLDKILRKQINVRCELKVLDNGKQLEGKIAVITGGGNGIGKAIAQVFVNQGAKVVIIGRDEEKLKNTVTDLGDECRYLVMDLTRKKDINMFFEKCENVFSRKIDIFISNAGVYINKALGEYVSEDFDYIINSDLKSHFLLGQEYIRYCKKSNISGNMIFISSNRALFGDYGPYGLAKVGINHFVYGLAKESKNTKVRVNAVAPGMTATGINNLSKEDNLYIPYARGNRVILPEEISEVVLFLASDISKVVNGVIIPCDEGDYLR